MIRLAVIETCAPSVAVTLLCSIRAALIDRAQLKAAMLQRKENNTHTRSYKAFFLEYLVLMILKVI